MSKTKQSIRPVFLSQFPDLSEKVKSMLDAIPSNGDFALDYLKSECFSKHPSLSGSNSPEERKSAAIAKLMLSDDRCNRINNSFLTSEIISDGKLNELLKLASTLIGNLLFGFEDHLLDDTIFSNGASQGFKLRDAAPYNKIAGKATVTPACYDLAVAVVKTVPAWYRHMQEFHGDETNWFIRCGGNGVFTVPKNSIIDRAAAKEPDMNMYLQKGAGSFIRKRLRSAGIDLNDQTRNQQLAREGSISNLLATIDLSSASDSISDRLVWELLPPKLYSYLDLIRSKRFLKTDGTYHVWSLFSTMGNGFTFELESLIFWALAKACIISCGASPVCGVYGDDIIVPVSVAPLLLELLRMLGFLPNEKKTFVDGPFRESCGAHYLNGNSVKPFYVKKEITDITRVILLANLIRQWGVVDNMCDPRLYRIWHFLSELVPDSLKGGKDVNSPYSLVTLHAPRNCLQPIHRRRRKFRSIEDSGRYVHYLHTEAEVIASVCQGSYVERRNKVWWIKVPTYPSEC